MVDRTGPGSFRVHAETVDRVQEALRQTWPNATVAMAQDVIVASANEAARVTRERQANSALPALEGDSPEAARSRARAYFEIPAKVWAIAVVGVAGHGKSTLINWLRKLDKKDPNAAGVGITSSTKIPTLYPLNVNGVGRVQLWDTPPLSSAESGFPRHLMAAFDVVVIVVGDRFMEQAHDAMIQAAGYGCRIIYVRSKLDLHLSGEQWDHGVPEGAAFEKLCDQWKDEFAKRVLPKAPNAVCFVYSATMMGDEETRSRMLFSLMPPKQ